MLANQTAGSPTDKKLKWTNRTRKQIAEQIKERGLNVGISVVKQLLDRYGFAQRKAQKKKAVWSRENRQEQFEEIAKLKAQYLASVKPDFIAPYSLSMPQAASAIRFLRYCPCSISEGHCHFRASRQVST